MKKVISILLILAMSLMSSGTVFAASEAKTSSPQADETISKIKKLYREAPNASEIKKINEEVKLLHDCGIELNRITDIKKEGDKMLYETSLPESEECGIVSIEKKQNGDIHFVSKEGTLVDNIVFCNDGKILLDNNEVTVERSVDIKGELEALELKAMYGHASESCPYGKASDYTKKAQVVNNDNIKLNKRIGSITINGLASILLKVLSAPLILKIGTKLAAFLIKNGKIDNPNSKALSHKTTRYYHKKGKYVKPGMRVMKNVAYWYTKASYKGKSHKKVTYSIYEQA